MSINFTTATFRDFENIPDFDIVKRAEIFYDFLDYMKSNGHMNYRLKNNSGCSSVMNVDIGGKPNDFVSFVSNDYLGFTQHPKVKQAAIEGIQKYGTGAGASPLIGGHFVFHDDLEKRFLLFWEKTGRSCHIYNRIYC